MKNNIFNNKNILITGGTGSFGNEFTKYLLKSSKPKKSSFTVGMSQNK